MEPGQQHSDNDDAMFGPTWRVFWVKAVLACGLLCGFLIAPSLWLSERAYPTTPVTSLLPKVPAAVDPWWFGVLLVSLVAIPLMPRSRWPILLFVCLSSLLSLWDQSRWQPWFYQYLFMLAAFCFSPSEATVGERRGVSPTCLPDTRRAYASTLANGDFGGSSGRTDPALDTCRFIMAATYFWSGLQKFNVSFLTDVYPWLLPPFLSEPTREMLKPFGVVVPVLEAGIGLGLLIPRLRTTAVVLVLAMHTFLLLTLGPLGHNWNTVVWPWNIAMMFLAVILFWRIPASSPLTTLLGQVRPKSAVVYRGLVLLLFGIMPGFSLVGLWDAYLSAALYSGNSIDAKIYVSDRVYQQLPKDVQDECTWQGDCHEILPINWSMKSLNVPPYPARRVFRQLARYCCALAREPSDVILLIRERPDWWTGKRAEVSENCRQLMADGEGTHVAE